MLALALGFAAVVMALNGVDVADEILCSDEAAVEKALDEDPEAECYDGSSLQRGLNVAAAFAAAGLALAATILALLAALTARVSPVLFPCTFAAIVCGGLSILIGSL